MIPRVVVGGLGGSVDTWICETRRPAAHGRPEDLPVGRLQTILTSGATDGPAEDCHGRS